MLVAGEDVVLRTEPHATVTVVTSRTLHDAICFAREVLAHRLRSYAVRWQRELL